MKFKDLKPYIRKRDTDKISIQDYDSEFFQELTEDEATEMEIVTIKSEPINMNFSILVIYVK